MQFSVVLFQKPNVEHLEFFAFFSPELWLFCQSGCSCAHFALLKSQYSQQSPQLSFEASFSLMFIILLSEKGGRGAAQQEGASNSPQRSDTAAVSPAWPQAEEEGAFQEFKFSSTSSIKQHNQRGTSSVTVVFWCSLLCCGDAGVQSDLYIYS